MKFINAFNKIMDEQNTIALATSVGNTPNVRIINFLYDSEKKGLIYFTTFKDNPKEKDFAENNIVSFTTIPVSGNDHVRATGAIVQKSSSTVFELKDAFIKKVPDYEEVIKMAGDQLVAYEIHFKDASISLGMNETGCISL